IQRRAQNLARRAARRESRRPSRLGRVALGVKIEDLLEHEIGLAQEPATGSQIRVNATRKIHPYNLALIAQTVEMTIHAAPTTRPVVVLDEAKHHREAARLDETRRAQRGLAKGITSVR